MEWRDGTEATAWDLMVDDTWLDMGLYVYLLPRGRVGWESAGISRTLENIRLQRFVLTVGSPTVRETWVKPDQRIQLRSKPNDPI